MHAAARRAASPHRHRAAASPTLRGATTRRSLKEAVDSSLEHLRAFMDWAWAAPEPVGVLRQRLRDVPRRVSTTGDDWIYGLFTPRRVGARRRRPGCTAASGPEALEIGYWIRASRVRQGLATEAAAALTRVAFECCGVDPDRDPRRPGERAEPRRSPSGSATCARRRCASACRPCGPASGRRDEVVFSLLEEEYAASPAAAVCGRAGSPSARRDRPPSRRARAGRAWREPGELGAVGGEVAGGDRRAASRASRRRPGRARARCSRRRARRAGGPRPAASRRRASTSTPFAAAFSRVTSTATSSTSTATTGAKPSFAAAIERTPEPQPTSSSEPRRSSSSSSSAEPGRGMRAGAERTAGVDHDRERLGRRLLPRRPDPERADPDRVVELAPAVLPAVVDLG